MRRYFLGWGLAAAGVCGCASSESLAMRPTTSAEGWQGNAFYRNGLVASEEFATGARGYAIDVWRFYDNHGRLYTEERDTTGDGQRDLYRSFNKDGTLAWQKEDTDGDGIYDRVVNYKKDRDDVIVAARPTDAEQAAAQPRRERRRAKPAEPAVTAAAPAAPTINEIPETAPFAEPLNPPPPRNVTPVASSNTSTAEQPASRENWIKPITLPKPSSADSTNAATRVVPGPIFHHPSDDLGD